MKKRRRRHRYGADLIASTQEFLEFAKLNARQGREELKARLKEMGFGQLPRVGEATIARDVRRRIDGVMVVEEVIDPDGIIAAYREQMDPYAHGFKPSDLSARISGRKRRRHRTFPKGLVESWDGS